MLGITVGMNAQSYLPAEDAVLAIDDAVANINTYSTQVNVPTQSSSSAFEENVAINDGLTDAQIKQAFSRFLVELKGSIKQRNDTQAGYDALVASLSADANTPYRVAGLDAAKNFALQIIAN